MSLYADLEITLFRSDSDTFGAEMRFCPANSDEEKQLLQKKPELKFDFEKLRASLLNPVQYGKILSECLFSDPDMRTAFMQAQQSAQSDDASLRVRLYIRYAADFLHNLRWETLRHFDQDAPLLTGERILFSRYLSSMDWRPVPLLAKGDLSALIVIANPQNLSEYGLAAIDTASELERAKQGIGNIRASVLAEKGAATLNNIVSELRKGCDILFLICHGALVKGESQLFLEDDAGQIARTPGSELIVRLKELRKIPRLAVLVSCQSAGTGQESSAENDGALAALGPKLAEAGIPAVLAMQGNVSMETISKFMPEFFSQLQQDGQIDRAMAVARGAVRERPDGWMPVLFTRLKSGRLWYIPGFAAETRGEGAEKWPALFASIADEECTPIIGCEPLFGSAYDIARSLAEEFRFPLAPHDRENLPQVAQFISVDQTQKALHHAVFRNFYDRLLDRFRNALTSTEAPAAEGDLSLKAICRKIESLSEAIAEASETHRTLAGLDLPIFITTDPTSVLFHALKKAGKDPQAALCPWNRFADKFPSIYKDDPKYQPDPERPLVYHLLGHISEPGTLVLTEDNFFDYLIGVTSNKAMIPPIVRTVLVTTTLLFLGFRLNDWDFRVLFRIIMNQEGLEQLKENVHVAVQLTPEEERILLPGRAQRYLENYFKKSASMSIYWGSAEDFSAEFMKMKAGNE